jgi:hypothetical protein
LTPAAPMVCEALSQYEPEDSGLQGSSAQESP